MASYQRLSYPVPIANGSGVQAINSSDVVAGGYSAGQQEHGFISTSGETTWVRVDFPGSDAVGSVRGTHISGIDDNNDVAGSYEDSTGQHAFARLASGAYVTLNGPSIPDAVKNASTQISAVSGSGEVIGAYAIAGTTHLFEAKITSNGFDGFKTLDLKDKNGNAIATSAIVPTGINDDGDVVGWYDSSLGRFGFVEHAGITTTLAPPAAGQTFAEGINNQGEVVGYYRDPNLVTEHGFTYTEAAGFKTLDFGDSRITEAYGVNDAGEVTGSYEIVDADSNRRTVGFVLNGNDLMTVDSGVATLLDTINDNGIVGGYSFSAQAQAAIFGPDSPSGGATYAIVADAPSVVEGTAPGSGITLTFTVSRSDSSRSAQFQLDFSGEATEGNDYTVAGLGQDGNLISFNAGERLKTFTITTVPDSTVEADESVIATLRDEGASLASTSVTISNDDAAAPPPIHGGDGSPPPAPVINPPTNNSPNPPSNNTAAPSVAFDPDIAVAPGDVVTLSGSYTAAAGISSIVVAQDGGVLGTATVNSDGTWSLTMDFTGLPGPHTGITATATDAQGQTGTARSPYNLTTDYSLVQPDGYPYRTVQDRLDPTTGAYTGSVFFNRNGSEYFESQHQIDGQGGSTYTYSGGSFFDAKSYSSFADHYDLQNVGIYGTDGALTWHAITNDAGIQTVEVYGGGQTLDAGDPAATGGTRFVFSPRLGDELIANFITGGPGHDKINLGNASAGRLTSILDHARDDGAGNTVLSIGHGNTITLAGVAPGDLTRRDFALHG